MTVLSGEALEALRGAVADHNSISLPIVVDRKVYIEIDRALSRIAGGGRWDRKARAHVYNQDPRDALEELTGSAVVPRPVATRDKELSYWATPPALAKELIHGLDLAPGTWVLEPSAGDGAVVRALAEAYPHTRITAVEPDHGRRLVLRRSGPDSMHVQEQTFEDYAEFASTAGIRWQAVVMNPPFTLPGRRYAWAEHLALAWDLLAPGGQLRASVVGVRSAATDSSGARTDRVGGWDVQASSCGCFPVGRDRRAHADRGSDQERGGDLMADTFDTTEEIEEEMDRNADSWPTRRED